MEVSFPISILFPPSIVHDLWCKVMLENTIDLLLIRHGAPCHVCEKTHTAHVWCPWVSSSALSPHRLSCPSQINVCFVHHCCNTPPSDGTSTDIHLTIWSEVNDGKPARCGSYSALYLSKATKKSLQCFHSSCFSFLLKLTKLNFLSSTDICCLWLVQRYRWRMITALTYNYLI